MHAHPGYWVFAYGSLIWNPGFAYARSMPALLRGAHRSLCVYSYRYRGTPERPGLVFGLVRGGSCRGMAFRVEAENWSDVRAYLRDRELVTNVYREVTRPISFDDGTTAPALTYVVDETHPQFAGQLDISKQLELVLQGQGQSGRDIDYVLNTADHLKQLGMEDRQLRALSTLLRAKLVP